MSDDDLHGLQAEVESLRQWKAETTEVILGLQDLGKALELPPGGRITSTDAARAAERLVQSAAGAEAARDLWKERCLRACDRAESADARHDALVADLRGLADSWDPPVTTQLLQEGFGWDEDMSALANDIRAVLDKHAGEQAQGGEGRG